MIRQSFNCTHKQVHAMAGHCRIAIQLPPKPVLDGADICRPDQPDPTALRLT
jgi:hypothetical protein